ncbi:hypothetical protein CYY_008482 [Polysphondylium violaceum]|uniref:Uncharacterized protein n=1 Tax=Polysphondylium violaceum TaxID=133409 RepID=A0A8J4PNF5_9MYCE|nr:hypothetical protein CYY_008482 [Polysphondylium violaceum]
MDADISNFIIANFQDPEDAAILLDFMFSNNQYLSFCHGHLQHQAVLLNILKKKLLAIKQQTSSAPSYINSNSNLYIHDVRADININNSFNSNGSNVPIDIYNPILIQLIQHLIEKIQQLKNLKVPTQ